MQVNFVYHATKFERLQFEGIASPWIAQRPPPSPPPLANVESGDVVHLKRTWQLFRRRSRGTPA
ncbi:hypothetical protein J6590_037933 [Homalodisca vitripennis]|nr:hypothetical protein J6590_037933 [Homalodisca vitripennis]